AATMSTGGSPANGLDEASSRRSRPAPAAHGSVVAPDRRNTPHGKGRGQPRIFRSVRGHGIGTDADGGQRNGRKRSPVSFLCRCELACPLRHRARAGPTLCTDAGGRIHFGAGGPHLFHGPMAPGRPPFPFAVPVFAHGAGRRVPDGRPVQSLRLLRGDAGRLLRLAAAWFRRLPSPL